MSRLSSTFRMFMAVGLPSVGASPLLGSGSRAGLSRDAVSKSARVGSPATQAHLRDIVEILNRVRTWAGSPQQAFAWYRSQPLPSFGDQTAEALVKEGRG